MLHTMDVCNISRSRQRLRSPQDLAFTGIATILETYSAITHVAVARILHAHV